MKTQIYVRMKPDGMFLPTIENMTVTVHKFTWWQRFRWWVRLKFKRRRTYQIKGRMLNDAQKALILDHLLKESEN